MPVFDIEVEFVFKSLMRVEAVDAASIPAMVDALDHDQTAHLTGKSYADVSETDRREVISITEVV